MRKHRLTHFAGLPDHVDPGWVQTPGERTFALGFFLPDGRFAPIALADDRGRVYATDDPHRDLHDLAPQFFLFKEGRWRIPDGPRLGHATGRGERLVDVLHGGVVGVGPDGNTMWLASWLKTGGRYTLEQLRADLPERMLHDLEYRDAIATAFFAAYLLPRLRGLLLGFGSGNIFRRLNRQAPLSAIRASARDAADAHAHGLRVSGLEDHAVRLMREAGALDAIAGLEPDHGAEPMHLVVSEQSGNYYLTWDTSLPFDAALTSLKIEGNLNRFAQVSSWLEYNGAHGLEPIEDDVSQAQCALIDQALLRNPALSAFAHGRRVDLLEDPAFLAVNDLLDVAGDAARRVAQDRGAGDDLASTPGGEWELRQTLAALLRRLRLPYRFDADMRADLASGRVAIAFTTAGPALMPVSAYDLSVHGWVDLDAADRARMSARYNLRVGLIMATLAFGAHPDVEEVTLNIDSIGLEEAIAEQDSVIKAMMSDALNSFEQWHERAGEFDDADKSEPKDGAQHGAPMRIAAPSPTTADADDDADDEFEQLMRGGGIDEVAFRFDEPQRRDGEADPDPLERLRKAPTVTTLVGVTFTRRAFLARLASDGLEHPEETFAMFGADMAVDDEHGLAPSGASAMLHDPRFAPAGAQDAPEAVLRALPSGTARVLGADDTFGLAIQREDLLAHAVERFHELATDDALATVDKAQRAMDLIERIHDPELTAHASEITAALIDGEDTPDPRFEAASRLDEARTAARDLLFSGQVDQALERIESVVADLDERFATGDGVPRYFNSYADRVLYDRMFATPRERTVLIPDNLFYAHMELADALGQLKGAAAALPHLNRLVSYAPSYALSHLKLAVQLARNEDWDPAKAACLNALRVALDRGDAAYAYYRLAQASWMRDEFDVAVAAYMMSDLIAPNQVQTLREELAEVRGRARSQCIAVPNDAASARRTLAAHDIPVWPDTEAAPIVIEAARRAVDEGMFVPGRTLAVAAARMGGGAIDAVQLQFLRSLNA